MQIEKIKCKHENTKKIKVYYGTGFKTFVKLICLDCEARIL